MSITITNKKELYDALWDNYTQNYPFMDDESDFKISRSFIYKYLKNIQDESAREFWNEILKQCRENSVEVSEIINYEKLKAFNEDYYFILSVSDMAFRQGRISKKEYDEIINRAVKDSKILKSTGENQGDFNTLSYLLLKKNINNRFLKSNYRISDYKKIGKLRLYYDEFSIGKINKKELYDKILKLVKPENPAEYRTCLEDEKADFDNIIYRAEQEIKADKKLPPKEKNITETNKKLSPEQRIFASMKKVDKKNLDSIDLLIQFSNYINASMNTDTGAYPEDYIQKCKSLFKAISKNEDAVDIFIPLYLDNKTGAGVYIIGNDIGANSELIDIAEKSGDYCYINIIITYAEDQEMFMSELGTGLFDEGYQDIISGLSDIPHNDDYTERAIGLFEDYMHKGIFYNSYRDINCSFDNDWKLDKETNDYFKNYLYEESVRTSEYDKDLIASQEEFTACEEEHKLKIQQLKAIREQDSLIFNR